LSGCRWSGNFLNTFWCLVWSFYIKHVHFQRVYWSQSIKNFRLRRAKNQKKSGHAYCLRAYCCNFISPELGGDITRNTYHHKHNLTVPQGSLATPQLVPTARATRGIKSKSWLNHTSDYDSNAIVVIFLKNQKYFKEKNWEILELNRRFWWFKPHPNPLSRCLVF